MSLFPRLIFKAARLWWRMTRPITLGVRLLLVNGESVLLVKHTYQADHWFLVGGGVKRNENLLEAAQREAREEVGATLGDMKLLGVYTNFFDYKSDHVVVFVCEDFALSGSTDHEIEKAEFFPLKDLPVSLAAGHRRRIQEYLAPRTYPPFISMW